MKRNKSNTGKSGISPYRRYNKRPYRYSDAYYQWFRDTTGQQAAVEKFYGR